MGAVVMAAPLRGICRHHPYVERLTGLLRQAQIDEAQAYAGQCVQRGLNLVQIQGQIRGDLVLGGRRNTQ
ncbi:hypothetical protein D3C71_2005210 [compost metagenome]